MAREHRGELGFYAPIINSAPAHDGDVGHEGPLVLAGRQRSLELSMQGKKRCWRFYREVQGAGKACNAHHLVTERSRRERERPQSAHRSRIQAVCRHWSVQQGDVRIQATRGGWVISLAQRSHVGIHFRTGNHE